MIPKGDHEPARDSRIEHFVTLFDSRFLPMGLALHESLSRHGRPFRLWTICMDDGAYRHLQRLAIPDLVPVALGDAETPELLAIKPDRTHREYCWNLAPFSFDVVFQREPAARRVTYLDADVFFFDDPSALLEELDQSGRNVLVTEHAYAPEYDQTATSGRFCVQFLTFDRSDPASHTRRWWQERCLECCQEISKGGKFGDQLYLDEWPALFGDSLHIVQATDRTLAPWNVRHFGESRSGPLAPVFYHFHNFRVFGGGRARLFKGYRVGPKARPLYDEYVAVISEMGRRLERENIRVEFERAPAISLRRAKRIVKGVERFASLR